MDTWWLVGTLTSGVLGTTLRGLSSLQITLGANLMPPCHVRSGWSLGTTRVPVDTAVSEGRTTGRLPGRMAEPAVPTEEARFWKMPLN